MAVTITLNQPRVIAVARDRYLTPTTPFPDGANLPGVAPPKYGQDMTCSVNRRPPGNYDQGKTVKDLEPQMRKLLGEFAVGDKNGMSKRLFDEFLKKQPTAKFFDDRDLNRVVLYHENIKHFCSAALSAPNMPGMGGRIRIHQALRNAGWDINKMVIPTDLGVPALNEGLTWARSGDYDNGLGLMVNGIQYAYCVATKYEYDSAAQQYAISIRFVFYDVFGLDDDDLKEYGVEATAMIKSTAAAGITAWWQLQHQHGYSPLVTRMIIDRNFEAPAK